MSTMKVLQNIRRQFDKKASFAFLGGAVITGLIIGAIYMALHSGTGLAYQQKGVTIPWLPSSVTRWNSKIIEQGKRYNVDPNFIAILMTLESGGYSQADSGFAMGLMQIAPGTADDISKKFLLTKMDHFNIKDPATNIEFGAAYIAHLRDTFCGNDFAPRHDYCAELVAAGYNGGPGAANSLYKGEGLKSIETLSYSRDAMNMWRERKAATSPTFERWKERGGQTLIDKANAEKL